MRLGITWEMTQKLFMAFELLLDARISSSILRSILVSITAMPLNLRPSGSFGKGSVEVEPPARQGESGVRRLEVAKDALVTQPAPGVETIPDIIDYVARVHGNRDAMGWRDVLNMHEEKKEIKRIVDGKEKTETKLWKYFELSDYRYIDYIQLKEAISEAAHGLVELGAGPDDVIDMFAETRYVATSFPQTLS
jgi:long-chain acyl-CoA synthetase